MFHVSTFLRSRRQHPVRYIEKGLIQTSQITADRDVFALHIDSICPPCLPILRLDSHLALSALCICATRLWTFSPSYVAHRLQIYRWPHLLLLSCVSKLYKVNVFVRCQNQAWHWCVVCDSTLDCGRVVNQRLDVFEWRGYHARALLLACPPKQPRVHHLILMCSLYCVLVLRQSEKPRVKGSQIFF
jgi:hypothetical protein